MGFICTLSGIYMYNMWDLYYTRWGLYVRYVGFICTLGGVNMFTMWDLYVHYVGFICSLCGIYIYTRSKTLLIKDSASENLRKFDAFSRVTIDSK